MKWDSNLYDNNHGFVSEYGKGLLEYLPENEQQTILDLGCGTGTLTVELSKFGKVIGMDSSTDMVERAQRMYPQLEFVCGDACNIEWENRFDIVFSNAVFHWINNQDALLESVYKTLKPGGMLICEFGAEGNIGTISTAFEKALGKCGYSYDTPFYFPSVEEYKKLLQERGFAVKAIFDFDRPTKLEGGSAGLKNWVRMFFAGALEAVDDDKTEWILSETEQEVRASLWNGEWWTADYRRLRVIAEK